MYFNHRPCLRAMFRSERNSEVFSLLFCFVCWKLGLFGGYVCPTGSYFYLFFFFCKGNHAKYLLVVNQTCTYPTLLPQSLRCDFLERYVCFIGISGKKTYREANLRKRPQKNSRFMKHFSEGKKQSPASLPVFKQG